MRRQNQHSNCLKKVSPLPYFSLNSISGVGAFKGTLTTGSIVVGQKMSFLSGDQVSLSHSENVLPGMEQALPPVESLI